MGAYDVFISHAHADQEWVHVLAENLRGLGLEIFLDAWEIAPGDVLVHALDRGLRDSLHGVLVVSPAAMSKPWVAQEVAALLQKAVEQGRRLIPVLLEDAELPPLLASRLWIDFRGAGDPGAAEVAGADHGTEERLWKLYSAFERRPKEEIRRDGDPAGPAAEPLLYRRQLAAGDALARAFLPSPVAAALGAALAPSARSASFSPNVARPKRRSR